MGFTFAVKAFGKTYEFCAPAPMQSLMRQEYHDASFGTGLEPATAMSLGR
ncbi:MAG: hypothetical protein J6C19_15075 [Lachnospiraceae bacterium]|nr:hypothetical protein [Lachnospiraceae bacterium]